MKSTDYFYDGPKCKTCIKEAIIDYYKDKTKKCITCGYIKSMGEFTVDRSAKDGHVRQCRDCWKSTKIIYRVSEEARKRKNQWKREWGQKLKLEVFRHYTKGTMTCMHPNCDYSDVRALELDHINNDGAEHRKQLGSKNFGGRKMYSWLIKHDFPKGFQVLCCNHNKIKEYERRARMRDVT